MRIQLIVVGDPDETLREGWYGSSSSGGNGRSTGTLTTEKRPSVRPSHYERTPLGSTGTSNHKMCRGSVIVA